MPTYIMEKAGRAEQQESSIIQTFNRTRSKVHLVTSLTEILPASHAENNSFILPHVGWWNSGGNKGNLVQEVPGPI
jgi:hypothetical protein